MPSLLRKTKIVATLGPATDSAKKIEELIRAGVNVFRLNFSHGSYEHMFKIIKNIRAAEKKTGQTVAIFQDLQGPKIRVGDLGDGIELVEGEVYTFVGGTQFDGQKIPIPVKEVIREIKVGDRLLFGDGDLKVRVTKKTRSGFQAKTIYGGLLKSKKGIIGENKTFSLAALTKKDYADIDWAYQNKIHFDYIAFSFVKSAAEVHTLRKYLKDKHGDTDTKIIVKFETALAVENMLEIIDATDVIMVARGDLGLEVPFEELPILQKQITETCLRLGKPAIVATNMLESMIINPLPTRAEVIDIANAVFQRASGIMLSGETSVGRFPVQCVETMDRIARRVEKEQSTEIFKIPGASNLDQEMTRSASYTAKNLNAEAILVFTKTGRMASLISKCRPTVPIFAFTPDKKRAQALSLHWGIYAQHMPFGKNPEAVINKAIGCLKRKKIVQANHSVVIVSDILVGRTHVDSALQVRTVS